MHQGQWPLVASNPSPAIQQAGALNVLPCQLHVFRGGGLCLCPALLAFASCLAVCVLVVLLSLVHALLALVVCCHEGAA